MRKMKKAGRWLSAAACALGMVWFILPVFRGRMLTLGTIFGELVCLAGLLLLRFYPTAAGRGGWRQAAARLCLFCYGAGLAWCAYLTVLMGSARAHEPPPGTNIILLGSQVFEDGELSISLKRRVEAAGEYLRANPQAVCIATGGQGDNEPYAESLAEKRALMEMGIGEERILTEDKSRNTRQNMEQAARVAEENGLPLSFAVVTQDFHLYRAMKLAESTGLQAYALPARTDPMMFPSYYGRELLSLTKWQLQTIFQGG